MPVLAGLALVGYFLVPPSAAFVRGDRYCSLTVLDRTGVLLREVRSSRCGVPHWVSLDQVSPWLKQAVVVAEDKRFFRHRGVDPVALVRALVSNIRAGRIVSGGSTITQQLVRNLYLSQSRTLMVKLAETLEALRLELHLSKERVLEAYLNRVGFGNQVYGIDAAARLYFDRNPKELSLAQSCFLGAILRAPTYYNPYHHYGRALRRQHRILEMMRSRGLISRLEYETAVGESIVLIPHRGRFRAPHFVDMVLAELGRQGMDRAGGRVRTSLDWSVQQQCEELLENQLSRLRSNHATNGALVVLERSTGNVVAVVGSRNYFDPDGGQVNASLSPRQTGSAIKPFAYAAAFEHGMTPATILPDIPHYFMEQGGDYTPSNYDRKFHGPVSARVALGCSYNVPAVRVVEQIGPELLLDVLRKAGMKSLVQDACHYGLALGLGVGDVPLLELVNGYRVLANYGEYTPVRSILSVRDNRGDEILLKQDAAVRVFSPQAAYLVTSILADNEARASAFGQFSCLCLGFPCAVKTGTSKDYRDNWTLGYTSDYVVGVWIGNFDGSPMHRVSGVTGAGPLFRDIMLALHKSCPADFPEPEGIVRCHVCPKSGALTGPHCPNSVVEVFLAGSEPVETCGVHVLVRIDRDTGEPATDRTEPARVVEQVMEVYPSEYWAWMEQNGLPLPLVPRHAEDRRKGLAVLFPDRGDVFKIDPDVSREFQSILLKASVPEGTTEATWMLDGKNLARVEPPFTLFWDLEPGQHRVSVKTGAQASEEVSFLVIP